MEPLTENFQNTVKSLLIRHQSVLDILTKGQEASARVNRAVVKSVTSCGCLAIDAHKKPLPDNATVYDLKGLLDSNVQGNLCDNCRETIESEMGKQLFYIAALANTLDISLGEVFEREMKKLSTLRIFNMT